jgi:AmiR/NasT family two-component response regulator
MENIRCVIANMPQKLLRDIVENMVRESGDIEVVDQVENIRDVPSVIADNSVDLLIMGMESNNLPESCLGIMNRSANVPILGLVDDGRRLAMYLNNVGKNDILKMVRTLRRNGVESLT